MTGFEGSLIMLNGWIFPLRSVRETVAKVKYFQFNIAADP